MPAELADVLDQMGQDYRDRLDQFELYRDYRDGKHRFDWASEQFKQRLAWVIDTARENLCPTIIDVYCDKIAVDDWGVDENSGIDTETLDRLAAMIHAAAFGAGNAFTITWADPITGLPMPAFQRADQCIPVVDEENPSVLRAIGKPWKIANGHTRLNVYDDEKLVRWISRDKYETTAMNGSGQLLIRDQDWERFETPRIRHVEAHNFGVVPACWWKRKAPDPFAWGVSVLRDAIPVQDELNKLVADTIASSERVALPLRYIMDVAPELLQPKLNPATGKLEPPKLPFDERVNSILALTAKGPAGQFPAPDAASLIQLQEHAEAKMARVTGIPTFYFQQSGGDAPSGESLRVVSSRLVSGVNAFILDNTPTWNGQLQLLGVTDPHISWADPMPLSTEELLANGADAKALGLPVDEWLRQAGYDPDEMIGGTRLADLVMSVGASAAQTARAFMDGTAATY